jgi:RecJ-like exonuclease
MPDAPTPAERLREAIEEFRQKCKREYVSTDMEPPEWRCMEIPLTDARALLAELDELRERARAKAEARRDKRDDDDSKCRHCKGTGEKPLSEASYDCPVCEGTGFCKPSSEKCPRCGMSVECWNNSVTHFLCHSALYTDAEPHIFHASCACQVIQELRAALAAWHGKE